MDDKTKQSIIDHKRIRMANLLFCHKMMTEMRQVFPTLSATQFHAVVILCLVNKTPLRQADLCRLTGIKPSNVSRLLDSLTEKGYAARIPDPDNASAIQVIASELLLKLVHQCNGDAHRDALRNVTVDFDYLSYKKIQKTIQEAALSQEDLEKVEAFIKGLKTNGH